MADSYRNVSLPDKYLADLDALLSTSSSASEKSLAPPKEKAAWIDSWQKSVQPGKGITKQQNQTQHRLAYLDGLRGFAALLVYILHYQSIGHTLHQQAILESSFGAEGQYYFAAFPGIRLIFTGGHFAVTTFFIISGYVLSSGGLRALQNGQTTKLIDTVSSALFRRWFRLFIPCAITTFIWMTSWHVLDMPTRHNHRENWRQETWWWYNDFKNYSFVYASDYFSKYNFHLWSIPLEFRGSLLVYTALMAFRRLRTGMRLLCEAGMIFYFVYISDGWYLALFMMGMLLADIDILVEHNSLPEVLSRCRVTSSWFYILLLMISFYFGGVPCMEGDMSISNQPGWYYLHFLKPHAMFDGRWFFRFIASTLVMIAVPRLKPLKSFFETRFCQYLGKISFAFYLIHGNILFSLGDRMYAMSGRISVGFHERVAPAWQNWLALPDYGPLGLELNFLAPQMILLPLTLWMADIVTRTIDDPSVKFAQWLYKSMMVDEAVQPKREAGQIV